MKRIIIVGGGFGGVRLGRELKNTEYEIWMIDKNNFYQFQPLFYQVATSGLEPSSISFPLRKIFQRHKNCHVRMAEAKEVDLENSILKTSIGEFKYDHLVLSIGATTNFFGNKIIEEHAIPMKSVEEALYLRNRLLQNFEKALSAKDEEQKALLNIVVVGGGATGVEVCGALSEMKKYILPKDYPEIDFKKMNIFLVEGSPKTLGAMSEESSSRSREYLEKMGIRVMTNMQVKNYDGNYVELGNGEKIHSKTVIWSAGITGNTIKGLPENSIAKGNRILVNGFNLVEGTKNVYAIGDIALMKENSYEHGHPQVATVAIEQAKHLAKNFKKMLKGQPAEPFHYKDKGSLATVGRHRAVADLPFIKFQGFFAWVFWMFLHLMLVLGVKNKLLIFVNWLWKYFTFDQSLRLIIKPFKKPL